MAHNPTDPVERFWQHVTKGGDDECWLWEGGKTAGGYGTFMTGSSRANPAKTTAHRFAHMAFIGPIPDDYDVDHLCRVRLCVNPKHLEAVTRHENLMRGETTCGINAKKTHCLNGHAYAEHGYINPTTGKRRCKTCSNAYSRQYHNGFRGDVTKLPDGA